MIAPGDILAGKYAVDRLLGKGGMGYVFAAHHTQLDQRVAIKILTPELCDNPGAAARFLAEARASVRIRGEHVVRVLDVGAATDGAPFMVMEFLDGHDLARELEAHGVLSIDAAVDCVLQVCEALAEAHALGIVHRDLKPANLFLTERPDGSRLVKVLDFGISKALPSEADTGPHAVQITATQGLIGSPQYMSPEQIRAPKTVDTRSDIWSLGVILFQLLAGKCPFAAETPMSILAAVVTDPPPDLRELREDVPLALQEVIFRCLEKDPRRRYRGVVDLADELAEYTSGGAEALARITAIARGRRERSSSPPPALMRDDGPTLASGSEPPSTPVRTPSELRLRGVPGDARTADGWGHSQRLPRHTRWPVVVLGGAVLLVLGIVLVRSLGSSAERVPAGSPATPSATFAASKPALTAMTAAFTGEPPTAAQRDLPARDTVPALSSARAGAPHPDLSALPAASDAGVRSANDAGARTARARPITSVAAPAASAAREPAPVGDPLDGRR